MRIIINNKTNVIIQSLIKNDFYLRNIHLDMFCRRLKIKIFDLRVKFTCYLVEYRNIYIYIK